MHNIITIFSGTSSPQTPRCRCARLAHLEAALGDQTAEKLEPC